MAQRLTVHLSVCLSVRIVVLLLVPRAKLLGT